jgi:hypothetical protein
VISSDNSGTKRILGIGGCTSSVANQLSKNEEVGSDKIKLNKRQRKKSSPEGSRFFMVNLKSSVRINRRKEDKTIKLKLISDLCVEEEQRYNVREFGLRIVHHNVQSLSNKKNEIRMMYPLMGCILIFYV